LFGNGNAAVKSTAARPARNGSPVGSERKPEAVEVTTPRLYVGNLSFDATESDLFELFNGVGQVQNAEVVSYRHNQRSKGFAFVQMLTIEEAKRAVAELHDKEFLGRKLVVSGAKSRSHCGSTSNRLAVGGAIWSLIASAVKTAFVGFSRTYSLPSS
jgi:RNA recognition motif-containing protein